MSHLNGKDTLGGLGQFDDRDADSEDEGELTGNESTPATFRYPDTVFFAHPVKKKLFLKI